MFSSRIAAIWFLGLISVGAFLGPTSLPSVRSSFLARTVFTLNSEVNGNAENDEVVAEEPERERHTVFVGNLAFDSSEDDVKNLFEQYGTVESISIPRDRRTRQPRGFAFVDLSQPEECDLVVEKLNQQMFEGRILRVSKSAPRNDPVQQQKDTDDSRKKIYVGNIPFETTKEELMDFYRQFGDVHEVYVPVNAQTGLGRGFAFVTVEKGDMDKMIEATNGLEFGGRNIVVSVPLPPGEKAPERGSSSRVRLYVGNLSFYTTPDMLEECFSQYGTVYDVFIPEDPETGSSRGFAFVTMGIEDGKRAIDGANGSEVDGRTIRVNEAQPKRTGRQ